MDGIVQASINRGKDAFGRFHRRRWLRRTVYTVLIILIIYGLGGFFGVPYLLRRVLIGQVATSVHRPITVGRIAFNPFRLRLRIERLHVSDRDPQLAFVDLEQLAVKLSWASIVHLAPVVSELKLARPEIHIVRTGAREFNFSDLIIRPANQPPPPPSKPTRFAVYNIEVSDGGIYLDDRVLAQHHQADQIQLGVPFVANLPSKVDVYVKPLLRMKIDGSPFRLDGETKPFQKTQETVVDLSLHRLDLPSYFAYLPAKPPVKLSKGLLSALIHVHFVNVDGRPRIRLDGGAALDTVEVHDTADASLLTLNHAAVDLNEVEPLENEVELKRIYIDGLNTYLVRNAEGTTNLTSLTVMQKATPAPSPAALLAATSGVTPPSPSPSSTIASVTPSASLTPSMSTAPTAAPMSPPIPSRPPTPSSNPTPAPPIAGQAQLAAPGATVAPTPAPSPSSLNFSLDSFELVNSSVQLTDRSHPAAPAAVELNAIHATIANFKLPGQGPAPFEISTTLSSGGAITAKGNLSMGEHQAAVDAALNQLDLAALKAFAAPYLNGELESGKLEVSAKIRADFPASGFNLHVEPASASIAGFALKSADGKAEPLAWEKLSVALQQFDLATRQAVVSEVRSDGLRVFGKRDRAGQINLMALLKPSTPGAPPPPHSPVKPARRDANSDVDAEQKAPARNVPSGPQWHYQVASVTLDKASIQGLDEHGPKPVTLTLAPLQLNLKDISDDLSKPITVALDTLVDRRGSLKVTGTAAPAPLEAKLHLSATRIDLSAVNAYLEDQVNARLASAQLTMDGNAVATNRRGHLAAAYRGDLTLGGVRVLDKVTGDTFARWNSFSARRIDAEYGDRAKVHIGGLALSDFYTRLILNRDGRLNVSDINGNPREQPRSLTRANEAVAPTPTPTPTPVASGAPPNQKPLEADVAIGGITLSGEHINWTDNFIRPNYTADLTKIAGKIGAISTKSPQPADVLLNGLVNGSAPLDIRGSANPLASRAYLNITAKAEGVELPGISAYSVKYIGYPIVKGALTVNLHYILQNQILTADNHIFIDQLTFGDKVESKTAINLPVRLAVAVLKDAKGAINLDIPVSGSLNDPQFSIGGVIWGVLKNLIVRAATAPFNLIASAFGGNKSGQPLNYVEFTPGYAELTPDDSKRLDVVAKALEARPALKLDISGRIDPKLDTEGLRLAKVDEAVRAQWLKSEGEPESEAAQQVPKSDYDKYLKKAYKAAKFDKPHDALGLTKSLPPDEMKKLMAANEKVSDDDLHHLADRRADTVRAALAERKIDPARLFIVTPKLNADDIKDQSDTTRADLSIS